MNKRRVMNRKVMKMGKSSIVISLPKEWQKRGNISPGDTISVRETSTGELLLSPVSFEEKPIKIDVSIEQKHFEKNILYNYIFGADIIAVHSKELMSTGDLKLINEVVDKLSGVEITETGEKKVVLEYYGGVVPIQKLLKRFSLLITGLFNAVIDAFEKKDNKDLESLKKITDQDEAYYLIVRTLLAASKNVQLLSKLNLRTHDVLYYLVVIQSLREILKQLKTIRYIETPYNKEIIEFLKKTKKHYKKSVNLFYSQPKEPIFEAMGDIDILLKEIYIVDKKVDVLKPEEQQPIEDILNTNRIILSHIDSNLGIALLNSMEMDSA